MARIPLIRKIISGKEKKPKETEWEDVESPFSNKEAGTPSATEEPKDESPRNTSPFAENEQADSNKNKEIKPEDENNPFKNIKATSEPEKESASKSTKRNPFESAQHKSNTDTKSERESDDSSKSNDTGNQQQPSADLLSKDVTLTIDDEYTYFFVFGLTSAGKSAMLSGLIYYMETARLGIMRPQGDDTHQKRGRSLIKKMRDKVRSGMFVERTNLLNPDDETQLVTEINLLFEPKHKKLPPLKFCLLEMAGENLKTVEITEDGGGGTFDDRIDAFLTHPLCELMFICVVDRDKPEESEDAIKDFLDYLYDKGQYKNSLLLTVNKWDMERDEYGDNIEGYLKEKMPSVMNSLDDPNRDIGYLDFSIGKVNPSNNTFVFEEKDSKRLFKWIYKQAAGEDFIFAQGESKFSAPKKAKEKKSISSWWQKTKNRFSNG